MGIKYFFSWFRNHFNDYISKVRGGKKIETENEIDVLMLDLNGIFHNCAGKVFQYGNYAVQGRLLKPQRSRRPNPVDVYREIVNYVDYIVKTVQPNKRLILCIDGVAPIGKQNQQRSRRFKSAKAKSEEEFNTFDSNAITPGTKFMHNMSKYIDWWLQQKMTTDWTHLEVVFSNEKVPSEGEQKLVQYIRKFGKDEETFMIHGMDADIIMLALATHKPNFYILRETMMPYTGEFYVINIGRARDELLQMMRWEGMNDKHAINDFIFMCFMAGNDFLPQIPTVEIMSGGVDLLLSIYKGISKHLTIIENGKVYFDKIVLKEFLTVLSYQEKSILMEKVNKSENYYKDTILEQCLIYGEKIDVIFEKYVVEYSKEKFGKNTEQYSLDYLEGMQWVLTYYTTGLENWEWSYKNHYAPLVTNLVNVLDSYRKKTYPKTFPTPPFVQLLCVLPPRSFHLIPEGLNKIYENEELKEYYPEEFDVDLTGRKKEWEGIVLLPFIPLKTLKEVYTKNLSKVPEKELYPNRFGKSMIYSYTGSKRLLKSYYGDVEVNCQTSFIEF